MSKLQPDFSKGLLTVILQHHLTKDVLMVGYMNEQAFKLTEEEQIVTFFSRSKNRLWKKGETSGSFQHVKSMWLDCDSDALLIEVDPVGPTCHNGTQSCFNLPDTYSFKEMEAMIEERKTQNDEQSYTNYLLNEGTEKIAKKFGEEAFEVVIAAMKHDKEELMNELADVMYHMGVLMNEQHVTFSEVEAVLGARHQKQNNFKGERKNIEKW